MRRFPDLLAEPPGSVRISLSLVFMALIAVLSLTPDRAEVGDSVFVWLVHTTPSLVQNTLHVGIYGALAGLWVWTFRKTGGAGGRLLGAVAVAVVYGAVLEGLQTFVPGRFGSAYDVGLNSLGALAGAPATHVLLTCRSPRRRSNPDRIKSSTVRTKLY